MADTAYSKWLESKNISPEGADNESVSQAAKPVKKGISFDEAVKKWEQTQNGINAEQPGLQQPEYTVPQLQTQFGANDFVASGELSSYEQELNEQINNQNKSKQKALDYASGKVPEEDSTDTLSQTTDTEIENKKEPGFDKSNSQEDTAQESLAKTLSGKELAADDLAGLAAAQYLADNLGGKYGDDWGRFSLEGTYDEWEAALANEALAPYFTDITTDERFLLDNAFDFDTYWNYANTLNPNDMGNMSYEDWKLLNGTSAGAMNSFNSALVNNGYQLQIDPYIDAKGIPEGQIPFDEETQTLLNSYGDPLAVDLETMSMNGLSNDELVALLNAASMSYGARSGRAADNWTTDELAFLNSLEVTPQGFTVSRGNPQQVGYHLFANPEYDYFDGRNPYNPSYDDIWGPFKYNEYDNAIDKVADIASYNAQFLKDK